MVAKTIFVNIVLYILNIIHSLYFTFLQAQGVEYSEQCVAYSNWTGRKSPHYKNKQL